MAKRWSRAEDRVLVDMARTSSAAQIGQALGRSVDSVTHRCRAMGVSLTKSGENHPQFRHSDAAVEMARRLHESGHGPKWIAGQLGMPLSTVKSVVYYQHRR